MAIKTETEFVGWVREHQNGYCWPEEFPVECLTEDELRHLRKLAADGSVDVLPNGEKLHEIKFWHKA